MSAIELQRALFRQLKEKNGRGKTLASELTSVIFKSKPTIYKKMQGRINLTIEELLAICKYYQIDVDPLLKNRPSFSTVVLDTAGNTRMFRYQLLLEQLDQWKEASDTEVLIDLADPFVHLFYFPELVSYLMFWTDEAVEEKTFSLRDVNSDPVLGIAGKITASYRQVDRVEIWRPHILDTLCMRLIEGVNANVFQDARDAMYIANSISRLLSTMERRYRSKLDKSIAKMEIQLVDYGSASNTICVRSGDEYYLYRGNWHGDWTMTSCSAVSRRSYRKTCRDFALYDVRSNYSREMPADFFGRIQLRLENTKETIHQHLKGAHD